MQKNGARIGIDVGGTFTDFVLFDPDRKSLIHYKEPSTPEDPSQALIVGLQSLLKKADLGSDQIDTLMHGTTIGLNAIIQRRGAKIALIVSEGYRDILEIARSRMPSSFDFHASKEEPLVPRHRIIEIGARLSANGTITQLPDDTALEIATQLNALDVDAAALVLINGYTNPSVETELAQKISAKTNGLSITSAAAIWPEIREYERTLIACLNAYIQPLMQRYFDGLKTGLARDGVHAPILVTASNGGSLSIGSAQERPVETILSGPASGVMAAARLAATSGVRAIITFDMGGTSSDIAVAQDGSAALATKTDIGGLPLVLPVVDVSAIGAGGGSIVWVDDHGVLKVGPAVLAQCLAPSLTVAAAQSQPSPIATSRLAISIRLVFLVDVCSSIACLLRQLLQRLAIASDFTARMLRLRQPRVRLQSPRLAWRQNSIKHSPHAALIRQPLRSFHLAAQAQHTPTFWQKKWALPASSSHQQQEHSVHWVQRQQTYGAISFAACVESWMKRQQQLLPGHLKPLLPKETTGSIRKASKVPDAFSKGRRHALCRSGL